MKNEKLKKFDVVKDASFMRRFFEKRLKFYFPAFKKPRLKNLDIVLYKDLPTAKSRYYVLKYTLEITSNQRIFKKIIRGSLKTHDSRKHAAFILKRLSHDFNKGSLRVPRYLEYYRPLDFFLYEDFPGRNLRYAISGPSFTSQSFYIKASALWLKKFHSLDSLPFAVFVKPFEALPARLLISLEQFKKTKSRYKKELSTLAGKWIKTPLPIISQKLTLTHGDFQLENIIAHETQKSIAVIDFDKASLNDPLFDLASFFVQWETMSFGFMPEKRAAKLLRLFIKTYLAPSKNWRQDELFRLSYYKSFFYLYNLLYFFIWQSNESRNPVLLKVFIKKAKDLMASL